MIGESCMNFGVGLSNNTFVIKTVLLFREKTSTLGDVKAEIKGSSFFPYHKVFLSHRYHSD